MKFLALSSLRPLRLCGKSGFSFLRIAAFAICLALGASAVSQDAPSSSPRPQRVPAPPMSYEGAGWLERHDREDTEKPNDVIAVMKLKPGDVVVDLGCGTGYFARRMAPLVAPGGKVLGVDIQQEMLDFMMQFAGREKVEGIVPILGAEDDPKLPKGEVDWILLVDVYHEFSEPEKMLARMRESLAPGGKVALVEYRVEDGTGDHIKPDHRMSALQVLSEWEPAGFALVDLHEFLPHQHIFIFSGAGAAESKPLAHLDLAEALKQKKVEAEIHGAGDEAVTVRLRNVSPERLVVTASVGARFKPEGDAPAMIARRDAAVLLEPKSAEPAEWKIRSLGLGSSARAPEAKDRYALDSERDAAIFNLAFHLQAGGTPIEVERAAFRIALEDAPWEALTEEVEERGLNRADVATLALVYLSRAGIDPKTKAVARSAKEIKEAAGETSFRRWIDENLIGAPSAPPQE